MIAIVVAYDEAYVIGYQNWMPWHYKEDLQHFKSLTLGKKIVMGRTTFQTLKSPLPNRYTYVITRDKQFSYSNSDVEIVHDFHSLLQNFKNTEETLYICGGASIYQQALPYVDEMWISHIPGVHKGDTFFPKVDMTDFYLQERIEKNEFVICHYVRQRKIEDNCDLQ